MAQSLACGEKKHSQRAMKLYEKGGGLWKLKKLNLRLGSKCQPIDLV